MSAPSAPRGRPLPHASALGFVRRAVGLEHNPLCRRFDLARSRLRLAVLAAVAGSLAVAVVVAVVLLNGIRTEAAETALHRHRVTATTVADAVDTPGRSVRPAQAQAIWQYPAGHQESGLIGVPGGAPAGTAVPIWVDDTAARASAPRGHTAMQFAAGVYGLTALTGMAGAVAGAYMLRRRSIERAADRAWEAEWAAVEPGWTRRGRPGGGTERT
ncbi:hypothetical protein KNE206_64720 [Kitasatospora sp. NE20-6]|uniref:Rv1733c family protein n=1 Tax=Kitasatospora sp. NE20-6 TaxID=2859066 RepID=UPI0034DCA6A8